MNIYNKPLRLCLFVSVWIVLIAACTAPPQAIAPLPVEVEAEAEVQDGSLDMSCRDCNVIMILPTSLRKDTLGLYGGTKGVSPNIDRFFQNALVFENAFAPSPWTLPSQVSLFTSLFPYKHQIMNRETQLQIPDNILTLAEIMKTNGYATAAFTGDEEYNNRRALDRGFDVYIDQEAYLTYGIEHQPDKYDVRFRDLAPHAIEWMQDHRDERFFLVVQAFEPHCPYQPGENAVSRNAQWNNDYFDIEDVGCVSSDDKYPVTGTDRIQVREDMFVDQENVEYIHTQYDGELYNADTALADLFEAVKQLRLEENTIVLLLSEHGEYLGEHNRFMRAEYELETFYDEGIHVPLLMRHPRIKQRTDIRHLVQLVDVLPTLTAMLGVEDAMVAKRQGKSVIPAIENDEVVNPYAFSASNVYTGLVFDEKSTINSIRNTKWKYIHEHFLFNPQEDYAEKRYYGQWHSEKFEDRYYLFDIENDPNEEHNLYETETAIVAELEHELEQWLNSIR
ncbi:MAG: sulfatase-like hydrolase/transferase [Chloroflexales bacterium]|nr:sulfatase-like hydrolase/transferase [Chloroflexales bacterium]